MSVIIEQDIALFEKGKGRERKPTSRWAHCSEGNDRSEENGVDISAVFIGNQFAYDERESHLNRSSNTEEDACTNEHVDTLRCCTYSSTLELVTLTKVYGSEHKIEMATRYKGYHIQSLFAKWLPKQKKGREDHN